MNDNEQIKLAFQLGYMAAVKQAQEAPAAQANGQPAPGVWDSVKGLWESAKNSELGQFLDRTFVSGENAERNRTYAMLAAAGGLGGLLTNGLTGGRHPVASTIAGAAVSPLAFWLLQNYGDKINVKKPVAAPAAVAPVAPAAQPAATPAPAAPVAPAVPANPSAAGPAKVKA